MTVEKIDSGVYSTQDRNGGIMNSTPTSPSIAGHWTLSQTVTYTDANGSKQQSEQSFDIQISEMGVISVSSSATTSGANPGFGSVDPDFAGAAYCGSDNNVVMSIYNSHRGSSNPFYAMPLSISNYSGVYSPGSSGDDGSIALPIQMSGSGEGTNTAPAPSMADGPGVKVAIEWSATLLG
jgi:hypothetical protein